jgi:uncharacterized protein (TIGR03435 family)
LRSLLLPTLACLLLAAPARAQTVELYHPAAPLASYEVASIKPADPNAAPSPVPMPSGAMMMRRLGPGNGQTIMSYILSAYGALPSQIVGGPAWLASDLYAINGKVPDDLRDAMQKMTPADRANQTRQMEQSLLADRFHLKAHVETRTLPLYELAPVKSGLKLKPVPAPPPFVPGGPPPALPPLRPGAAVPPGMSVMLMGGPTRTIRAGATNMRGLISLLRNQSEIGGKPILDETGFTQNFDIVNLQWATLTAAAPAADNGAPDTDAPSLFTALEETLGLKLTPAKGPVEVLVIDSIDRPSDN